jgi:hypothetical protein
LTEEIIPVHEDSRSPRPANASPSIGSPRPSNASPTVNQQPATTRMETPGSSMSPQPRDPSPSARRPDGSEAPSQSLEADIRDAVGLGLSGGSRGTETSEEGEFGVNP